MKVLRRNAEGRRDDSGNREAAFRFLLVRFSNGPTLLYRPGPFLAALFFSDGNATAALLPHRPTRRDPRPTFGALVFGRIGDLVGKVNVPDHDRRPWALDPPRRPLADSRDRIPRADPPRRPASAPGPSARRRVRGAATYVAEHALITSALRHVGIQPQATLGLLMALAIIVLPLGEGRRLQDWGGLSPSSSRSPLPFRVHPVEAAGSPFSGRSRREGLQCCR